MAIADFVWVPFEEVAGLLTNKAMKILWQYYISSKL